MGRYVTFVTQGIKVAEKMINILFMGTKNLSAQGMKSFKQKKRPFYGTLFIQYIESNVFTF